MTTEELHFEFKRRWDKNSNNNRRGLTDLEVDQLFNNVSSDYVDLFATGKNPKNYTVGFEVTGQMIDMVSSLVRSYPEQVELPATSLDGDVYVVDFASLSEPYRHFKTAIIRDRYCGLVEVNIEQHQDLASVRLDFHRKASKKWKRCPAAIRDKKLYLYTDAEFTISGVQVTYIKEPDPICLGTYTIAPTVSEPNPVIIKDYSETDIDDNFHHILVSMAVQEAARIYGDQFQLAAQSNKLFNVT